MKVSPLKVGSPAYLFWAKIAQNVYAQNPCILDTRNARLIILYEFIHSYTIINLQEWVAPHQKLVEHTMTFSESRSDTLTPGMLDLTLRCSNWP